MRAFDVVDQFERRIAEFAGARHCVALASGTWAIFLSLKYRLPIPGLRVIVPARTFVSVPNAVLHAGGVPAFDNTAWRGTYELKPWAIVDGALRFRRGMYEQRTLHCLSFQARKHLNIGMGGAILTDDPVANAWLRAARYSGRIGPHYRPQDITFPGWLCYMTPEQAARGLHLLEYIRDDLPDQEIDYPDLSESPLYSGTKEPA